MAPAKSDIAQLVLELAFWITEESNYWHMDAVNAICKGKQHVQPSNSNNKDIYHPLSQAAASNGDLTDFL